MKKVAVLFVLIGVTVSVAAYYAKHTAIDPATVYRVATIRRGDVAPTISATGTLEAEDFINVGAQVAGIIVSFGKDLQGKQIDFNSVVEKDMVLANIDPVPYQAALDQAEATLEKSKADLMQYKAKVVQTGRELKRAEALRPKKAIADTDYDTAELNYDTAVACVAVAKATIKANKAALVMARIPQ